MAKKCQHLELSRARDEKTDGLTDTWYCPEPNCDFELPGPPLADLRQFVHYIDERLIAVERQLSPFVAYICSACGPIIDGHHAKDCKAAQAGCALQVTQSDAGSKP